MQYLAVFGRQRSGHDAPPRGVRERGSARRTEYLRIPPMRPPTRPAAPRSSAYDRPYDQAGDKLGRVGPVSGLDKAAQAARPPLWADAVAKVDVDLAAATMKQISLSRHLRTAVSEVRYGDKAPAERRRSGAGNDLHSGHIDVSCTGASTNACTGADIRSVVLRNIRGFCRR